MKLKNQLLQVRNRPSIAGRDFFYHADSGKFFWKYLLCTLLVFILADCSKNLSSDVDDKVTFADVLNCPNSLEKAENLQTGKFIRKDKLLGLIVKHGFDEITWGLEKGSAHMEQTMFAGGLSAAYLNDDCWPDIIFASGDEQGLVSYINKGAQKGFSNESQLLSGNKDASLYKRFTGVAVADITGNFSRSLLLGNLFAGSVVVLSLNKDRILYSEVDRLPVNRTTYGISLGDINGDGLLDAYFAHWDYEEVDAGAPVLWLNTDSGKLVPYDDVAGLNHQAYDQRYNFTAQFADIRNRGLQDLVVASDFRTSSVLMNTGKSAFLDKTDRDVITDYNGMGAAIGDINNNGKLDWFVTAIDWSVAANSEEHDVETGNRLYKNISTHNEIVFKDITEASGVRDGGWGWAACMADFNHDGFVDIFHVNGFAFIPEDFREEGEVSDLMDYHQTEFASYIGQRPRLYINNGDGTFTDRTVEWGLDVPSEGRGVICFDYDRDGDIDIALVDHSTGIQFFENQTGHGKGKRFLNIRVVGKPPNTDAIGAKVYVTADVGKGHGIQRQMRVSHANSNFNSQNLPDIHFGLGEAAVAQQLRIEWTDGSGLLCKNVTTNQFLVFDQRDKKWPKKDSIDCEWYEDVGTLQN